MAVLTPVNATTWINLDTVSLVQDNGNSTYKVTLTNGTIFAAVPLATIQTAYPQFTPAPPPIPPQQGGTPR